jgi:hypothetical protein
MPIPFAHAGHWIVDLLTLVPAALIAVWFVGLAIRQRLRRDRD